MWGPIHVAIRVPKNHIFTMNYLQTKYKLSGESENIYDDLY